MDVAPETIREIEFREKRRGYSQDEVDEFLERVAAGVEILQERLRQVTERALRAEQQAREVFDGDDALRRTLGLAQRTADLAVQEAHDQAARIMEAAEAQAASIAEEALEQARRLAEEAQSTIWADVGRLEAAREQLRQDVATLARFLETERARAETALLSAAANLSQTLPGVSLPPSLHQIDLSSVRAWGQPAAVAVPVAAPAHDDTDVNGDAVDVSGQDELSVPPPPAGFYRAGAATSQTPS